MCSRALVALFVILLSSVSFAQLHPISIDGRFQDWEGIDPIYTDVVDGPLLRPDRVNFQRLWMTHDQDYLYFRFETTEVVDPSGRSNDAVLTLDTDRDPNTGLAQDGMGVDFQWVFGERQGVVYAATGLSRSISQGQLGLIGLPTVDANDFEFAIPRDALSSFGPIFPQDSFQLALIAGRDRVPEPNEVLAYTFDSGQVAPPEPISINYPLKQGSQRILSFNVLRDAPWGQNPEPIGRLVGAVAADIMCFQEIYNHSASQTVAWLSQWHPDNPQSGWYSARVSDCITVSRWPILAQWALDGNLATVIAVSEGGMTRNLLVINAHFPCCLNDPGREDEIDRILAFIRNFRANEFEPLITPETPIVITGDLNLVGRAEQVTALLTGNVFDEFNFGPDFAMDTDGSDAEFINARHTHTRQHHTWRDDGSSFWPGRLDYLISTDSSYAALHHFVLETRTMPNPALQQAGLLPGDSARSDHLPLVADFGFGRGRGDLNADGVVDSFDIELFIQATLERDQLAVDCPLCPLGSADMNGDGSVNAFDVEPFIECLINAACE